MFRYQITALRQAEHRVTRHRDRDGYYLMIDGARRVTESTPDEVQIAHWHRILIVRFALALLGHTPRAEAGTLSTSTYSAFAYEVEKYHV